MNTSVRLASSLATHRRNMNRRRNATNRRLRSMSNSKHINYQPSVFVDDEVAELTIKII